MNTRLFLAPLLITLAVFPLSAESKDPAGKEAELTKASYVQKANEEVKEWSTKIQNLEDRSQAKGAQAREGLDRHMQALRIRFDGVRKDLQRLSESGEGAWHSFRNGLEESMKKLREDYDKAASHFKKTEKSVKK